MKQFHIKDFQIDLGFVIEYPMKGIHCPRVWNIMQSDIELASFRLFFLMRS